MSISQLFPEEGPTLNLNFAGSKTLDPRITFTRTSTATYMDDSGLIKVAPADSPRFDHRYVNGEIESLGLLVEEARTNLKIRSEELQFDFGAASITTISQNEIISPDGLQTADGIVPNATLTAHYLDKVFTSTSGITTSQNICCSAFFKKGVGRDVWLQIYEESGNAYHGVQFNFETETLTFKNSNEYTTGGGVTTGYNVIKYPNGWYRLWVAGYPNTTTTGRRYRIRLTDASGVLDFSGDAVSSYVYSWGVQVEISAFPTSYIPTSGSTATRNHDRAVIEGSNFTDIFNTNFEHFSMFVNYDNTDTDDGTNYAIILFWGESTNFNNRVEFYKDNASPYHIETRAFGGGSGIFSNGNLSAGSTAATQKLATSWSVDYSTSSGASRRWAFSFSGESVDVVNDGTGTTIPSLTRIGFGINPTRTDFDGGKIHFKQISLYSNTLTDSQLQTLTK